MSLRMEVGLGPGDIMLDLGNPAAPPRQGAQQPPPEFSAHFALERSPISATAELLFVYESSPLQEFRGIIFFPVVSALAIIFLWCGFFLLFSSPNLSGRKLHVYHTSAHGVAQCEFTMQVWNVLHAARWKYRTQKIAILAPSHKFVGLYLRN